MIRGSNGEKSVLFRLKLCNRLDTKPRSQLQVDLCKGGTCFACKCVDKGELHSQKEKNRSRFSHLASQGLGLLIWRPLRIQRQPLKEFSVYTMVTLLLSWIQIQLELNLSAGAIFFLKKYVQGSTSTWFFRDCCQMFICVGFDSDADFLYKMLSDLEGVDGPLFIPQGQSWLGETGVHVHNTRSAKPEVLFILPAWPQHCGKSFFHLLYPQVV